MIATAVERVQALKTAGRTLDQAKAAKPLAGLHSAANAFVSEDAFLEARQHFLQPGVACEAAYKASSSVRIGRLVYIYVAS